MRYSSKSKEIKGGRSRCRSLLLKGGDTGPAIEPGNIESLFLDTVNYGDIYQMPPKYRLSKEDVSSSLSGLPTVLPGLMRPLPT